MSNLIEMFSRTIRPRLFRAYGPWALAIAAQISAGCGGKEEWDRFWDEMRAEKRNQPQPVARPDLDTKALQGAIGPLVTIEGARLTSVKGYGLVLDLDDTGGRDGPKEVKDYLAKQVRVRQEIGQPGTPAEELLNSLKCAVVEVTGLIPAAAKKGDRFDVVIRALGTQASSLVGGRLELCELKLFAETPQGIIEGKPLATASGPVFVSIFNREGKVTTKIDRRQGFVLGGGVVKEPRRVRLVLNDPRYSTTQQIVNRLNGRYTPLTPIAEGKGAGVIDITIPEEWRSRKRVFLEQIGHTTVNDNPALLERRAQELVEEIKGANPNYDAISLAWQAIGKIIFPRIRPLYSHSVPEAAYYAVRAGFRLGDTEAVEPMCRFASEPDGRFQMQAIDELGFATRVYGAGETLRKLLDDKNDAVRIRAYRALRRRPHGAIRSRILDKDNLILDVLDSHGPYLIYVQRLNEPRIAVFGSGMACKPPLIFPTGERDKSRGLLTDLSAQPGDSQATVVFHNKRRKVDSPKLSAPLNVGDLITFLGDSFDDTNGNVSGLAVPYSEIVEILYTLCDQKSIPARFVVEDLKQGDDAPVEEPRERPESDY